jgi:hypothetical protein
MYLEQIDKTEKRKGFAAAISAGALMAQKANSNGGKRPPKDKSEEKPLEPHEMFSALEMLELYLPGYFPEALRGYDASVSKFSSAVDWLTPAQAEDLVQAFQDGCIPDLLFAQYLSRDWQGIVTRAAKLRQ